MASYDTEQSATDKAEQHTQKEILRKLAELGGGMHKDDAIAFGGEKIQIPKTMTVRRAIKFLTQVEREMETETTFTRTFNYRPWDGAYCMWNVFKRTFGAVSHTGTMGFFGPNPPQMLTIPSGPNSQTQVPWGTFGLPILEGAVFETDQMGHPELGPLFQLSCYSPKKWADQIEGIFNLVEEELKTNSMYRGKAFDGQTMPEFIDLSGVDPSQVVYSKEVMTQLEVNVWAQLRHTDEFVREGIPLKRAVLVHGPYGCISGDALMGVNRAGKGFQITLRDLVNRFNGTDVRYGWDQSIPTYVQREQDGIMRLAKIVNAWESGVKETYTVLTDSGRTIRATDEHPFLTDDGWKRLDELLPGTMVHVRGEQGANGRLSKPRYAYTHVPLHPFTKANGVVATHRLVAEAAENDLDFDSYVKRVRVGETEGLTFLDPTIDAVHHIDGDSYNNETSNLAVMTRTEHARLHAIDYGTQDSVMYRIATEMIVAVTPYGEEMTYDIEVEDDPHNFIADGFVVHNTGKTLAAILTGQEATANGWTFIKGRPGRDNLGYVMQTARLYQPAVVFYEDVDQIADGEVTDTQGISQLLDVFDGIEAKDTRILCVLTSNHADRIHKGMARPGRLDAMIEIDELDLAGVTTLVKVRLGDRLATDIDWAAVFAAAEGYKPAFVTEFSDRAIRYALDRVLRDDGNASQVQLTTDDLVESARGLRPQYELMVGAKDRHEKPVLDDALGTLVTKVVRDNLNERVLVENSDN